MRIIGSVLVYWIPLAIVTTLLVGLSYVSTQQSIRQAANDPQIQLAQDIAVALEKGQPAEQFALASKTDMAKSLAPFVIIFDQNGQPIVSTVELDGSVPVPPAGVFDYTKKHTEDRISWQPKPGVR